MICVQCYCVRQLGVDFAFFVRGTNRVCTLRQDNITNRKTLLWSSQGFCRSRKLIFWSQQLKCQCYFFDNLLLTLVRLQYYYSGQLLNQNKLSQTQTHLLLENFSLIQLLHKYLMADQIVFNIVSCYLVRFKRFCLQLIQENFKQVQSMRSVGLQIILFIYWFKYCFMLLVIFNKLCLKYERIVSFMLLLQCLIENQKFQV